MLGLLVFGNPVNPSNRMAATGITLLTNKKIGIVWIHKNYVGFYVD